jgi:hypothetical protein
VSNNNAIEPKLELELTASDKIVFSKRSLLEFLK